MAHTVHLCMVQCVVPIQREQTIDWIVICDFTDYYISKVLNKKGSYVWRDQLSHFPDVTVASEVVVCVSIKEYLPSKMKNCGDFFCIFSGFCWWVMIAKKLIINWIIFLWCDYLTEQKVRHESWFAMYKQCLFVWLDCASLFVHTLLYLTYRLPI